MNTLSIQFALVALLVHTAALGSSLSSYSYEFSVLAKESAQIEFKPSYLSMQRAYRGQYSGNVYTYEANEENYNIAYTRGLNEFSSVRVQTYFGERNSRYTRNNGVSNFRSTGMGDFSVTYNWLQKGETSNVLFGSELSISTEPNQTAMLYRSGNLASGGHSIRPFVGYEHATHFGVIGGLISYQVFGKKTSLIKSSTGRILEKETESGGNVLELGTFAEYKAAAFLIGGSISYSMMDPTETVDSLEIIHNDPRRFLSTKIYGRKVVAEDLSLIPSLRYRTLRSKNIDNFEYSNSSDLALQVNIELAI